MPPRHPPTRTVLLLVLAAIASAGCVRRRLTVRTNPPGATVFVDNQRIGTSPCSVDFTYYGTREIRMVKPGFETLTVNQPIPTPNYDRPGIDFFTENVLPTKIRDNRVVSFNLAPQQIIPAEALISRGQQLRDQATTIPSSFPVGVPLTTEGPALFGQPAAAPPDAFTPAPPPGPSPFGAPSFVTP
ncbi:MAG: PEGA domain-containing protein [Planctomycetota bacterium]